jgi:23S rRNA (guanine745-N1)-methyltransferase
LSIYKCPVCDSILNMKGTCFICDKGHSFDKSSSNYVNLLLGNQKNSKDPGDNKEMMECRRDFLNKGYYLNFSDMLNSMVKEQLNEKWEFILDAGCGEGYYIANLKNELETIEMEKNVKCYGMDISKHAIKYAAKRDKEIMLFVGSNFDIPIISDSIDCIIRNFAPGDNEEFHRILKSNGKLIILTPGIDHLYELKLELYDKARKHDINDVEINGFKHIDHQELKYNIELENNDDIKNLISMTPYYWSIKPETRHNIDKITELKTKLHFNFDVYCKL